MRTTKDNGSIFSHLTGSIQAKDIQSPLGPSIRASHSIGEALDVLTESAIEGGYWEMSRISLVVADNQQVVSWIGFDMLDADKDRIESVAAPIMPGQVVSGDTRVLEVVKLLAQNTSHFYFVLQEARITGTLHYEDLFRSPFKLCMFALMLELEAVALDLALQTPAESWAKLSEGRRQKAETTFEKKFRESPDRDHPPFDRLLSCTMYCDKGEILKKLGIGTDSPRSIKSLFSTAERVRNACAHTGSESDSGSLLMESALLPGFIADTEKLISAVRARLRKESP